MVSVIAGDDGFNTSAGGILLQTRYKVFKDPKNFTTTKMTPTVINELTVSITPKSANSVFKLELCMPYEAQGSFSENMMVSATRNGSFIAPPNVGSRVGGIAPRTISVDSDNGKTLDLLSFSFIDEPATTSPIVYTAAVIDGAGSHNIKINATISDLDNDQYERGMSTFIVTELSGT